MQVIVFKKIIENKLKENFLERTEEYHTINPCEDFQKHLIENLEFEIHNKRPILSYRKLVMGYDVPFNEEENN